MPIFWGSFPLVGMAACLLDSRFFSGVEKMIDHSLLKGMLPNHMPRESGQRRIYTKVMCFELIGRTLRRPYDLEINRRLLMNQCALWILSLISQKNIHNIGIDFYGRQWK